MESINDIIYSGLTLTNAKKIMADVGLSEEQAMKIFRIGMRRLITERSIINPYDAMKSVELPQIPEPVNDDFVDEILEKYFDECAKFVMPSKESFGINPESYEEPTLVQCYDESDTSDAAMFDIPYSSVEWLDKMGLLFKNVALEEIKIKVNQMGLDPRFNWVITRTPTEKLPKSYTGPRNYVYDIVFAHVDNSFEFGAKHAFLAKFVSHDADIMIAGELHIFIDETLAVNLNSSNTDLLMTGDKLNPMMAISTPIMLCQLLRWCGTKRSKFVQEFCHYFKLPCSKNIELAGTVLHKFYVTAPCLTKTTIEKIEKVLGGKLTNYSRVKGKVFRGNKDSYKVLSILGSGGFGTVFKVESSTGEIFADKVTRVTSISEIDLMVRLEHPNLIHAHEAFCDEMNFTHIILPLADKTLKSYLTENRKRPGLNPEKMIRWFYEILSAMIFLKDCGYYHCDLKPDNILICNDRVLVADLGLSSTSTTNPAVCGTVGWYGPETQIDLGFDNQTFSTEQADVFGLGALLCDMLRSRLTTRLLMPPLGYAQTSENIKTAYQYNEKILEQMDLIANEWKPLIAKMMNLSASARPTLREVLANPLFAAKCFSTPIPGRTLHVDLPGYKKTPKFLNPALESIASKEGSFKYLYAFVDLSRLLQAELLGLKANDSASMINYLIINLYGQSSEAFDSSVPKGYQRFVKGLLKKTGGAIRRSHLPDVAVSQAECWWGFRKIMTSPDWISTDQLHYEYCSKVETAEDMQNRLPVTDGTPADWKENISQSVV
jgi:serine/threonine protein kinase